MSSSEGPGQVVLLSFALVLRTHGGSAPEVTSTDAVPPRWFHPVLGPLSVVILLLVALVGLTGKQVVSQNITPETFWVLTWIRVPLTCGLLGDWSRAVNPFANLARLAGRPRVPFDASPSWVVFVLLLVSSNVEGLLATPQWASYERRSLGTDTSGIDALRTGSLIALVVVVLAVFLAFAVGSARAGCWGSSPFGALAGAPACAVQRQLRGRHRASPQQLLPVPVGGGHRRRARRGRRTAPPGLVQRAGDETRARRSEYPWLVGMVTYTAASLLLIAQPLTQERNSTSTTAASQDAVR